MANNRHKEYEKDFYAWAIHNAQLIRNRKISEVDFENVAEEIESMGKSERRELINRLAILISHLLKWQFQKKRRGKSWRLTIKNQRRDLLELIKDSPSLKSELNKNFDYVYEKAVGMAAEETKMDEDKFPVMSPFTLAECFDINFFPS